MTGSLHNRMYGNAIYPTPEVGMGATKLGWTDRYAGTIIEVDGKRLLWQRDTVTRTDGLGMTDAQQYDYAPNPNGTIEAFTLRKDGSWVAEGSTLKNGTRLAVGGRQHYHDYSF